MKTAAMIVMMTIMVLSGCSSETIEERSKYDTLTLLNVKPETAMKIAKNLGADNFSTQIAGTGTFFQFDGQLMNITLLGNGELFIGVVMDLRGVGYKSTWKERVYELI